MILKFPNSTSHVTLTLMYVWLVADLASLCHVQIRLSWTERTRTWWSVWQTSCSRSWAWSSQGGGATTEAPPPPCSWSRYARATRASHCPLSASSRTTHRCSRSWSCTYSSATGCGLLHLFLTLPPIIRASTCVWTVAMATILCHKRFFFSSLFFLDFHFQANVFSQQCLWLLVLNIMLWPWMFCGFSLSSY